MEGVSIVEFMQLLPLKIEGDGGAILCKRRSLAPGDFEASTVEEPSLTKSSKVLI